MSGIGELANEFGGFGAGLGGVLLADNAAVKGQLDLLTTQAGDGLIADTYAGLGNAAATALSLQPEVAHHQVWQDNIAAASGRLQVTQTALQQISDIASNFYAQTSNLNDLSASETDNIAANARAALQEVAGLLDSADGNVYVFAGQDSQNPPVPSPDAILSSGFFTQIQASVAGLAASGGSAVASATLATARSNAPGTSPFSAALSQPAAALATLRATVSVGSGQQTPIGVLASGNGASASGGSSTTGSYMRDILRGLATIGSLSSSQAGNAGFPEVVGDTRTSLGNAITALTQDAGILGDQQSALQTQATGLSNTSVALKTQLSGSEDVDMAFTLSLLTQTQTQLQASYQLIVGFQSLSLVKYLSPAG